jgi:hypothetical protein
MSTIETNRSWTHFRVDRRNPRYCHVTFDHPPIRRFSVPIHNGTYLSPGTGSFRMPVIQTESSRLRGSTSPL